MQETTILATSSSWRSYFVGCTRDFPTTTSSNASDAQFFDIRGTTSLYNPASQDCNASDAQFFDIRGTTSLYNPASQDCQQVCLKKISSVSSTTITDFITVRECLLYHHLIFILTSNRYRPCNRQLSTQHLSAGDPTS